MPVQCPSCTLLFGTRNELDWHLREEHTRPSIPPAGDLITPADPTAPVTVGAGRAGPDGPPLPPDPSEPDTAGTAPGGPLGWLRRLLRRSGASRHPPG